MSARHVLVVDDEARIREVLQYALAREGFRVSVAADGQQALEIAERDEPDLVVLDVMLPEIDGLEVCRKLRRRSRIPVLFLSARGEEIDRIVGLELGGDDYLTKPFSPRELVARVRAVLRRFDDALEAAASVQAAAPAPSSSSGSVRSGSPPEGRRPQMSRSGSPPEGRRPQMSRSGSPPEGRRPQIQSNESKRKSLQHDRSRIDFERFEVRCGGTRVDLTRTELGVLAALLERPGVVLSRNELMDRGYSDGAVITERTIDTHVRRIRRKFRAHGLDPITTVHGVGYKASGA